MHSTVHWFLVVSVERYHCYAQYSTLVSCHECRKITMYILACNFLNNCPILMQLTPLESSWSPLSEYYMHMVQCHECWQIPLLCTVQYIGFCHECRKIPMYILACNFLNNCPILMQLTPLESSWSPLSEYYMNMVQCRECRQISLLCTVQYIGFLSWVLKDTNVHFSL